MKSIFITVLGHCGTILINRLLTQRSDSLVLGGVGFVYPQFTCAIICSKGVQQ